MADAQSQFANSQFLPPTLAEQALEHALDYTPQASSLQLMLRECAQWRARVESALLIWEHKLTEIGLMSPELAAGCDEIRTKLKQNGYTVALVAEVSRGKSELINALLFSDHKRRIVPAGAGRTTMCPTEFLCDLQAQPYIELLPIETRLGTQTLTQLFSFPAAWERVYIDANDSDALARALQRVSQVQSVQLEEAVRLGLEDVPTVLANQPDQSLSLVEVPRWRHARVNLHHPMLANGLVILDTPGLNALGYEPELTYAVLPTVDAVLFMLSIEAGVTRTDQHTWSEYLGHLDSDKKFLILNKIDTLGDGLRSSFEVQAQINQLQNESAKILNTHSQQAFAVSAQQALIARIHKDDKALVASRLPILESALTQQLQAGWFNTLVSRVTQHIHQVSESVRAQLEQTHRNSMQSYAKNEAVSEKSLPMEALNDQAEITMRIHDQSSGILEQARDTFNTLSKHMRQHLVMDNLEPLILAADKACAAGQVPAVKAALMVLFTAIEQELSQAQRAANALLQRARQAAAELNIPQAKIAATQAYALDTDTQEWRGFEVLDAIRRLIASADVALSNKPLFARFQGGDTTLIGRAQIERALQITKLAQDSGLQWIKTTRYPVEYAAVQNLQSLVKKAHGLERIVSAKETLAQYQAQLANQIANERDQMDKLAVAQSKLNAALARHA